VSFPLQHEIHWYTNRSRLNQVSKDDNFLAYSSVGTAGATRRAAKVPLRKGPKDLFSRASRPPLRTTQPPIQMVLRALSPGVKRQGREADHSPPSRADIKNGGTIPPLPIRLHGVVLINKAEGQLQIFKINFYNSFKLYLKNGRAVAEAGSR
jgi:hypothetical protein